MSSANSSTGASSSVARLLQILTLLQDWPEYWRRAGARFRLATCLLAIRMAAAGLAVVMLGIALYLYAAQALQPWQAAALTGGLAALVALLLSVSWRLSVSSGRRSASRRPASPPPETAATGDQATASMLEGVLRGANLRASDLMLVGLLAGALVAVASNQAPAAEE